MAFACDSCRRRSSGRPTITVTGHEFCESCYDCLTSAAMGLIGGRGIDETTSISSSNARVRVRHRGRTGTE